MCWVPRGLPLWKQFLPDSNNKEELFEYLSLEASKDRYHDDKHIPVNLKDSVLHVGLGDIVINTRNHEEANTCIVIHLMAAARTCQSLLIWTSDTDVLVIAIAQRLLLTESTLVLNSARLSKDARTPLF